MSLASPPSPPGDPPAMPACFGRLEQVFPVAPGGNREVPEACWPCPQRVACLKAAVRDGAAGHRLEEELAARQEALTGGVGGFVRRWARLKAAHRREEKK